MDYWVQGMGLTVGAQIEQIRVHSSLFGLPELSSGVIGFVCIRV